MFNQNYYSESICSIFINIFNLVNIISSKYLIICILLCIYISYYSLHDLSNYSTYSIDNYKDYILSGLTKKALFWSKYNLHLLNNKILHPITLFLQNF